MIRRIGRKLWIGAGLLALLAAALLAIPSIVDANAYKPEIIAQVKQATGRDVTIDGPIRFALLPAPEVTLDSLHVANVAGADSPDMVEAKSVTMRLSLLGLLTGELRPADVTLVEPRIALQIDSSGQSNWRFPATPGSTSGPLPCVVIDNGTLTFRDARSGLSLVVARAALTASAGSIDGPFSLTAAATVNDVPMTIDLAAGTKGSAGHALDVTLQAAGGRLSFAGTASELGPDARLSGKVSASADNLVAFARALIAMAGRPQPPLPPLLAGRFKFDGSVELSPTTAAARDFTLALGDDSGMGSLAVGVTPSLAIEGKFAARRLDLDRWLAALALPGDLKDTPVPPTPAATTTTAPAAQPDTSWLAALTAKLALEVDEVIYRGKAVRNLVLELQAENGLLAVPKFNATLPGDLAVQATSTLSGDRARPAVSGSFSLEGQKLRETLAWLDIDVSSIPADKLNRLSMKGRMGSRAGTITVSDAAFGLDDLAGKGGILVTLAVPVSVVTHIELGKVDLDPYLPPADRGPTGFRLPVDKVTPILALLGPSIGLKLKVDRVDWKGEAITGVELDVARAAGTLNLNSLRIASLVGARVSLRAAIANYWTKEPKGSVAFEFRAPDIDRVLKLVGQPPSGVGPLAMTGNASGSWETLAVKDFTIDAMGWQVLASGVLAAPEAKAGVVQRASWKGNVQINGQAIETIIDVDLSGAKPVIDADLRTGMLDFSGLTARHRGAARTATAPDFEPIGTPLQSVDGSLKVSAAGLGGAAVPLGKTEIAATLKDGVLTVSRFTGALDGGTIALSGVFDGSKPLLSFDLKGEARGIDIAQLMRRQSGSNEIGSLIRIAVDGRLDATTIALRGAGTTAAELRSSLAGGADIMGHVQARADRFLALLGSAATGAAGGAIDLTIGNIMSALGERGGVGVGNLLNAISLVLYRYVNHDNVLAGHIDIANGLATDRNLTLRGNGVTAGIATRTDLSRATTDTTINFVLAEVPSAPYLIVTARGPIEAPSFSAVRGPAADPPGVFDRLPRLPHVTLPSIPVPHVPLPHIPNPFGR